MRVSCRLLLAATLTFTATLAAQQSSPIAHIEAPPPQGPARDAQGNLRVSGGVMATLLIKKVDPEYSPDIHESGAVVLRAIIGPDGKVTNLAVISGPAMLQSSAVNAVRQWEYTPYRLNGRPVAVDTTILVKFKR